MKGYDSPTAALAALVECLSDRCARIHVGALGTGESLDCCPGCLLRVETSGLRVQDGMARSLVNVVKCHELILDVVVNYRECFKVFTKDGKTRPIEDLTAEGTELFVSWWDVLRQIACCRPMNQYVRFVSIADSPPEGNCAGWTMVLEMDVSMCGCP